MIKVFNWWECKQQHCLRMILADSLYTSSLFNTASFHFQPANVLNLWPVVHRYFVFHHYDDSTGQVRYQLCKFAIPLCARSQNKPDLHVATSVLWEGWSFYWDHLLLPIHVPENDLCLSSSHQNHPFPWSSLDLWSELLSLLPHIPVTILQFRSSLHIIFSYCCP